MRVAHKVSASLVLPMELSPEMEAALGAETCEPMMVATWQEKLLQKLNLDGLSNWTPRNLVAAREHILAFHDIFTLDGNELGCTSVIEHEIRINNSEPFKEQFRCILCHFWMRYALCSETCWTLGQYVPAMPHGATLWYWFRRRMEPCTSAWISTGLTCVPRRTCIHCHGYRKHWRVWWALHTFQQWTLRVDFGKSGWHPSPNSILPSQWQIWNSTSLLACPLGYAIPHDFSASYAEHLWRVELDLLHHLFR